MDPLSLILTFIKKLTQIKDIGKFVANYKWYGLLFLIAIGSATYFSSNLFQKFYHNKPYEQIASHDKIIDYVDEILLRCGDKTGITISAVSLDVDYYTDSYSGRTKVARACDIRELNNNCIVDLKTIQPSLYAVKIDVDLNSYQLLLRLGDQTNAARFYLRDRKNEQNISSLNKYSSIKYIVENTDWYKEKTLYNLWVTSILSSNHVLYIITYLSGTSIEKSACYNPSKILNDIKQFIIKK